MRKIPECFRKEYIKTMRSMIGHAPLVMTACGIIIENEKGKVSCKDAGIMDSGESREAPWSRERHLNRRPDGK